MDDQDVLRDSCLLGHLTCGDHRSEQAGVQVGAARRMRWSIAEEASACAATAAQFMGLVCFDVRQNRLGP
ncbi:hypothetical protein [Streptomyces flaveolus]|uniref:hypothetical protein n=1 Tax=Streptomyces flaveolus TaxID=67297 RepID=UPI0036CBB774